MAGGPLRARPRPALRYGHKAHAVFESPSPSGRPKTARPDLCAPAALHRPRSPVPEGKKEQAVTVTNPKGTSMSDPITKVAGTLEHVDPNSLHIGLSARKRVTRVHGPVRDMENAFATHRRRS
jgi:hypothetical protein